MAFKGLLLSVGLDAKGFSTGLSAAQKDLQAFSSTATVAGFRLSAAWTATFGALAAFTLKVGTDFESAFAGIKKTIEGTPEQFAELEQGLLDISQATGIAGTQLSDFARIGGQVGVGIADMEKFTDTIAKLSIAAAELDPEDAAVGLARLVSITGEGFQDIDKLGSVLALLGDELPTTESRILDFSVRISGLANAAGLTATEILGLSAGFSSLVGQTERGASAVERFLGELAEAVADGGPKLDSFAQLAGQSAETFSKAFTDTPVKAIEGIIHGLGTLSQDGLTPLLQKFDELGIKGVRAVSTFAAAAGGADLFSKAIFTALEHQERFNKLQSEFETQMGTVRSQFDRVVEGVKIAGITLFQEFRQPLLDILAVINDRVVPVLISMAGAFGNLPDSAKIAIIGIAAFVTAGVAAVVVIGQIGSALVSTIALISQFSGVLSGLGGAAATTTVGIGQMALPLEAAAAKTGVLSTALGSLGPVATAAASAVGTIGAAVGAFAIGVVGGLAATDALTDRAAELQGGFDNLAEAAVANAGIMSKAWEGTKVIFATVFDAVGAGVSALIDVFGDIGGIVGSVAMDFIKMATPVGLLMSAFEEIGPFIDQAALAFDQFGDMLTGVFERINKATGRMPEITNEITLAQVALVGQLGITIDKGETWATLSEKIAKAQAQIRDEVQKTPDALAAAAAATEKLSGSISDQINKAIQAAAENKELERVAKALGMTEEELSAKVKAAGPEFLQLAAQQVNAREKSEELRKELEKLREELGGMTVASATKEFQNFSNILRDMIESGATFTDQGMIDIMTKLRELGDVAGKEVPADLKDFAAAAEEAGKRVQMALKTEEARKELEALGKVARELEFNALTEGLKKALEAGEQFSSEAMIAILRKVEDAARESGQKIPEELRGFLAQARLEALQSHILVPIEVGLPEDLSFNDLVGPGFEPPEVDIPDIDPGTIAGGLTEAQEEAAKAREQVEQLNSAWDASLNLLESLGISADSAFGKMIAGLSQVGEGVATMQEGFAQIDAGDIVGGMITAVQGGIEQVRGLIQATGQEGVSGLLGGAAAGAKMGMMFGPWGAAIGAAAGAAIAGIRSLIKTQSEQIADDIERDFGVRISEELAKSIEEMTDALDIGEFEARLLHLSDIIEEAGGVSEFGFEQTQDAVIDMMNAIELGSIPAEQGLAEVGEVFGQLAAEAVQAGELADSSLLAIIQRSRELGQEIPEIAAFVQEQLAVAAAGLGTAFAGIKIVDVEDAQAQATLLSTTFFATLSEQGLIAAVDALKPAFDALKAQIDEMGLTGVNLGGIERLFEIAGSEEFRPLIEGIAGLNDALVGLGNSGYLTVDAFSAIQQQGQAAFDQLIAAGLTQEEALQQIAPLLQSQIDAANQFGLELDANTLALIEQAEAAGIGFSTDPMVQMVDVLTLIAEQLGVSGERLAEIGGHAATAGQQVTESFTPAAEAVGAATDAMSTNATEDFHQIGMAADEAFHRISGEGETSLESVENSITEAAATMTTQFDTANAGVVTDFKELETAVQSNWTVIAEGSLTAVTAVAALGQQALNSASDFDALANAAQAAANAAAGAGGGGGGEGGGPHGGQFGLAMTVHEPTSFIAGEAGTERVEITPGGGRGGGGNGGGGTTILQIDGKTIGKIIGDLSRTGDVRIHPDAVSSFG